MEELGIQTQTQSSETTTTLSTEVKKKSLLPVSLIVKGSSALIFPLIILWNLMPATLALASISKVTSVSLWSYIPVGMILGIFIAEIIFGIRLRIAQNSVGYLTAAQRKQAIILFIIGIIAGIATIPMLIFFVIAPIYTVVSSIK